MTKKPFLSLIAILIITGMTSCATNKKARAYIVGQWEPYKLGSVEIKKLLPRADSVALQYSQQDYNALNDIKKSMGKPSGDGTNKKFTSTDFNNLVEEATTTYMFTREEYASRDNVKTPFRGMWKLNKKGNQVTISNLDTPETFVLSIDSLTSVMMIATNPNLKGMKVTYLKNTGHK
jgi:hypothetical protein